MEDAGMYLTFLVTVPCFSLFFLPPVRPKKMAVSYFMPINISRACSFSFFAFLTDGEYKMAVKSLETFRRKREECFDVAYQVRWDKTLGQSLGTN